MRRAAGALFAAVALVGCKVSVDPDLAGPYLCDPASPLGDEQCAGGWRCAADGVCRDPAVGAPTACETPADCSGGWHCGAAKVCYDRAVAGAIPCRPASDAGEDCAPGWRCPSGGICQQQGVFGPYPCETSADCEGGGHCGVAGRCYLRETAQDVACRQERDNDPAERDCGPGWVCGALGRCVDARGYDLRPNGPLSSTQARAVAPLGEAAIDHVSAECYRAALSSCGNTTALTVARGSRLELHRVPSTGPVAPPLVLDLSGPVRSLATTTVPGGALQAYSLVALAGGAVHVSWPPTGDPVVTTPSLPFVPERVLAPAMGSWFIAVLGPELALLARDSGALVGTVQLPAAQDGGALGYGALSVFGIGSDFWMTTTSAEGLFASRGTTGAGFRLLDGGSQALPEWTPVRVAGTSHKACPDDDGGTGALLTINPTTSGSTGSGSFRQVQVALVPAAGPLAGLASAYGQSVRVDVTPTPCGSLSQSAPGATCALCPAGSSLVATNPMAGVLCRSVGSAAVQSAQGGTCDQPALVASPLGEEPLSAVAPAGQLAWSYGGQRGQVIVHAPTALALRLNRAPQTLSAGPAGELFAHAGALVYERADAGFVLRNIGSRTTCASVRDAEDHRLYSIGFGVSVEGGATNVLENSEGVSCSTGSIHSEAITLRDGGSAVVIAARDRIWAQAPFPTDAGTPWPVRAVPASFANISSLATLRPSEVSAPWASAYVIANEQVYSVRAESQTRWSSAVMLAPDGEPFRVWADPHRGRVTYRDGTTFSLPHFAPIAGRLPEPSPWVRDLEEACGTAYALGLTGLYRLEGRGAWDPVPLPPGIEPGAWTAIFSVDDVLHAFTADGRSFEVIDGACARP